MKRLEFPAEDYIVMVVFLALTSAIGIYYGFFKKVRTTEEYALGNRQIHFIPVALSLAVTFQSAVSILGIPTDVYLHNIMLLYMTFGSSIAYMIQAFYIVPLVHPLRLISAYEYLQRRFQSRAVQLLGMTIGMLQTLLYVSIVLYSPALALEAEVVSRNEVYKHDGRADFKTNPDPRVRHTVWGCVIGGMFNCLPICCNQSSIQRISSIEKDRDAKIAALLNVPLAIIFTSILALTGLVMYSYFVLKACDPLGNNQVSDSNQLMIYFVMETLSEVPGLAGIFLAVVFSGALSSLSSGINSMATNALQDVLDGYNMESLQITKMVNTAFGAASGPIVGIFFLGSVFLQANKKGAFVGGICGIAINMWIAIGSFLYGRKAPLSKLVSTSGCIQNETIFPELNVTLPPIRYYSSTLDLSVHSGFNDTKAEETPHYQQGVEDNHIVIYDLSYVWFGLIGFLCAVIIGLAVSFITGKDNEHPTEPMYITPFLRRVWTFDESVLLGKQRTENCFPLIHKDEAEPVGAKKETPVELMIE